MSDLYKAHCPCGETNVVSGPFTCPRCGRKGEIDRRFQIDQQMQESEK